MAQYVMWVREDEVYPLEEVRKRVPLSERSRTSDLKAGDTVIIGGDTKMYQVTIDQVLTDAEYWRLIS